MRNPIKKEKLMFCFRMWALPMVLMAIYALQLKIPAIHEHGALWSDHPHGWQFFTCNFLSKDIGHLASNIIGLVIVYSQFAPQVRGPILALVFLFFSSLSTWIFHALWMPDHAWLIGASGGSYALLGFFSWFLRRTYFCVYKCKWLKFKIIPVLAVSIAGEYFYARWRMPSLAWQMHAIGFSLGVSSAMAIHAVYAASRTLADHRSEQGMLNRFCASIHQGICRIKQFAEISGKPGVAEEAV